MMSKYFLSRVSTVGPKKPVQYKKETIEKTLEQIIADVAPELSSGYSFYVNPLLSNGHSQTAYTALNKFENVDNVHYKRLIYPVESDKKFYYVKGDKMLYDKWEGKSTIAVDFVVSPEASKGESGQFKPANQKFDLPPRTEYMDPAHEQKILENDRPLVVALHGLAGGSYESYLRAFMIKVTKDYNFDGLVLNARGCANHTITSPQLFCGLWTNDLRYLINEHIRVKWPHKRIYLIGFSLGGSILANYLGQEGPDIYENIKGAAIMASPWDYPQESTALVTNYLGSKVYSPKMCQNLIKLLEKHYDNSLHVHDVVARYKASPESFKLENLRDFDDAFTAQMFGFNSAQEYYRHASPDQRLLNVRVPTLIVSSSDDPIVGGNTRPVSEVRLNPYTHMIVTSIGGHLGWFDWKYNRWYPDPLARVFAEWDKWEVEELPEGDLPKTTQSRWKHDRLVM